MNGKMRRSLAVEAFPCQPHFNFWHESSTSPNISMASPSDKDSFEHFPLEVHTVAAGTLENKSVGIVHRPFLNTLALANTR